MKNPIDKLLIIFLVLFLFTGCKITEIFDRSGGNDSKEPVSLSAKMLDSIPVPASAEIISDEKSDSIIKNREILLRTPASVYDVVNFYIREMGKNGWKGDERNLREKTDRKSIISVLRFSNADEEVDVEISTFDDDSSEINIRVSESDEKRERERERERAERNKESDKKAAELRNAFPMPSCAVGSNVMRVNDTLTLSADCAEEISSVAEFYKKEAPKQDWKMNNQNQTNDTVVLIFSKDSRKALVTLVKKDEKTTSVTVQINK